MKVTVPVKIGSNELRLDLEVEELCEIYDKIGFYQELPKACSACGSGDLFLNHRTAKGFNFYGLKCAGCGAELKFGQRKDGTGFFVKRGQGFTKYVDESFNQEQRKEPF